MGRFPGDFQEGKRPLKAKSGKRPIKVGKRPIKEGKRPIKGMVLVGISVGCLMGCFLAPPPWRKTPPLKRPIKGSMISSNLPSPRILDTDCITDLVNLDCGGINFSLNQPAPMCRKARKDACSVLECASGKTSKVQKKVHLCDGFQVCRCWLYRLPSLRVCTRAD